MNDLFIFIFGCVVTVFCVAAVSMLIWGVATEPPVDRSNLFQNEQDQNES